jgi:hypothetical protein
LAVLVHYQYEVRPAEIPGFTQFGSEALGLIYSFFRIRKALPDLIGKEFRAVQDMEKILRHGGSPEYHAKNKLRAGDSFCRITLGCLLD